MATAKERREIGVPRVLIASFKAPGAVSMISWRCEQL